MKPINVYECQHCKKLFRTATRHKCKFNPKLRNCFSCKHHGGWAGWAVEADLSTREIELGFGHNIPICKVDMDGWDIENIKSVDYNMQCKAWEGCKDGKA